MQFARRGFPFTDNTLCVLAYELASRNNRRGFSPLKKCAGRSWLKGFLARYPQLKKKVSQKMSITCAIGANPTQVGNFFNHYRRWIHQWGLECQPNHIWNVDECGISNIPQTQKVIGLLGERPFQTVSGEKPVNTTLLTYVSAGGLHVPPMVIFKASRVKPEWREYAPSGYAVRASESRYISTKLFLLDPEKAAEAAKLKSLTGTLLKKYGPHGGAGVLSDTPKPKAAGRSSGPPLSSLRRKPVTQELKNQIKGGAAMRRSRSGH